MINLTRRSFAFVLAAVCSGALASGCYVEDDEPPAAPPAVEGYEPMYYDGAVVYYDDVGRPYYYGEGGAVVWIPPSVAIYPALVGHWRSYGPGYRRWYAVHGYRYRRYRAYRGYRRR